MLAVQRTTASPKRAVDLPSTSIHSVVRCLAQPTGVEVPLVMRRHTTKPHASYKRSACRAQALPHPALSGGNGASWDKLDHGVPAPRAYCDVRSSAVGSSSEVSAGSAGDHSICSSFPLLLGLQVAYCLTGSLLCCLPSCHQAPSSGTPQAVPFLEGRPCLCVTRPFTVHLSGKTDFKSGGSRPRGGSNPNPGIHRQKTVRLSTSVTTRMECSIRTRLMPTHVGVRGESGGNAVTTGRAKARQVVSPRGGLAKTNRVPQIRPAKACLREALLLGRGAKPHMLSLWLDTPSDQHKRRFATAVLEALMRKENLTKSPY